MKTASISALASLAKITQNQLQEYVDELGKDETILTDTSLDILLIAATMMSALVKANDAARAIVKAFRQETSKL